MSEWIELRVLTSGDELGMPSLAHIDTGKTNLGSLLKVIFDDLEKTPHELRGRNITFVRLVSRAIRAYENARKSLLVVIDARESDFETSNDARWRATDELETVFNSLHRALRILRLLKGMRQSPVSSKHVLPDSVFTIINEFRDASEHIEERLIGKHPHAFIAYDRGFEYARKPLAYAELAGWLERLAFVANDVINVVEIPPRA
jgi:hypothetical protein